AMGVCLSQDANGPAASISELVEYQAAQSLGFSEGTFAVAFYSAVSSTESSVKDQRCPRSWSVCSME
ncbi:unnamed protein product, partial [Polarella glacialis]